MAALRPALLTPLVALIHEPLVEDPAFPRRSRLKSCAAVGWHPERQSNWLLSAYPRTTLPDHKPLFEANPDAGE